MSNHSWDVGVFLLTNRKFVSGDSIQSSLCTLKSKNTVNSGVTTSPVMHRACEFRGPKIMVFIFSQSKST